MNGPNPVCTSARKKMNQSRPRRLWRDGDDDGLRAFGSDDHGGSSSPPIGRASIRSVDCLDERTNSLLLQILKGRLQWLQAAGGAKHHDRRPCIEAPPSPDPLSVRA